MFSHRWLLGSFLNFEQGQASSASYLLHSHDIDIDLLVSPRKEVSTVSVFPKTLSYSFKVPKSCRILPLSFILPLPLLQWPDSVKENPEVALFILGDVEELKEMFYCSPVLTYISNFYVIEEKENFFLS